MLLRAARLGYVWPRLRVSALGGVVTLEREVG